MPIKEREREHVREGMGGREERDGGGEGRENRALLYVSPFNFCFYLLYDTFCQTNENCS